MKKEIASEEHCPYCKRHCPLSDPHCKKGRTLAEEKKKEAKKSKAALAASLAAMNKDNIESPDTESGADITVDPYIEEWRRMQKDIKLLHLFKNCYHLLPGGKGDKQGNKKSKFHILAILAEKGELTQKELKDYSELTPADLAVFLLKMKKKEYINWKQEDVDDTKISLTESGLELTKVYIKEKSHDRADIFSVLDAEEKEYLEHIMKKLYVEWSHEPK